MNKDEALRMALENINKAHAKVAALCEGSESWTMSVPPRPDYDHDMVITTALLAAGTVIHEALAQPKQKQGEPVAWQERQARRMQDGVVTEWTNWYPCRYRTIDEAQEEACDHIPYEWRPLYTRLRNELKALREAKHD